MSRAGLVLAAALAVGLAAPASAGTHIVGGQTVSDTTYLFTKVKVQKGKINFELDNSHGGDPHDLVIRKGTDNTGKLIPGGIPQTESGQVAETTVKLKPGKYYLHCDIASHEAQGMHQIFKVTE